MEEIVIDGSPVPAGHAIFAQSWKATLFSVLVDPLHMIKAWTSLASWSAELVRDDLCDVHELKPSRAQVDQHYVLWGRPFGPEYLIRRHDWGFYDV